MSERFQSLEKIGAAKALLVAVLAAIVYSCFAWWEQDDFYIHLQYVHNLITRGEWSFNAGTPSYGTTSPLWVIAVAIPSLLGMPPPLTAKLLAVGFAAGCVFLLLRARDLFRSPSIHAAAILALLADHWLRLAAGSGMEATMAAFLALLLGLSLIRNSAPTDLQLAGYGALSGLLMLTRPEFFVAPAIMIFAPRCRTIAGWLRGYAILLVAFAAVVAPWFAYAIAHFGSAVPNTVALKVAAPAAALIPPVANMVLAVKRQAQFFGLMYLPELLAISAALLLALRRRLPAGRAVPLAVIGLVAFLPAMYLLTHARGGESITYRYGAPVLPLLTLVGFLSLDRLLADRPLLSGRRIAAVVVLWAVVAGTALSALHLPSLRKSRTYLDDVLVSYGRWLAANSPTGSLVGCYDVGAIAYFSQRPVLDLIGLNNPEVVRLRDLNSKFVDLNVGAIRALRPDYLVSYAHADTGDAYAGLPVAETIMTRQVEPYRFGSGRSASPPHPCHLWRLDWSKSPPPSQQK